MSGDDLTIALFLIGLAVTFLVAAMSQAGWKHWAVITGLFVAAAIFFVAGVGWPWIKGVSPAITGVVAGIATNSVSWFVVIILGLSAVLFINRATRAGEVLILLEKGSGCTLA